ncbi:MAG: hypothetical protein V1712_00810 [Patescibacteria group bacterium]
MALIGSYYLSKVKQYYQAGNSAREIAEKLNVPLDAVYYFFRKYKIPRRSARENNELLFKKKAPSFKLKVNLSPNEELLKTAGVMLYWAEGSKWAGEVIVDFANSDPAMIRIFLAFLRKICGVNKNKLGCYLYCYDNQNPRQLLKFWSAVTRIPQARFSKPYIRKDSRKNKIGKMKYGLLHLRYYDKKLLLQLRQWINDFSKHYQ